MLVEVAIVPSAPLLVPELSGPNAREVEEVRAAALEAAATLGTSAHRWIVVGQDGPARRFTAFGADVPVFTGPDASTEVAGPLALLVGAWLRGAAASRAQIEWVPIDPTLTPLAAVERGVQLRAALAEYDEPAGVLIVADGATALTESAPGGGNRESAHEVQRLINHAVAAADCSGLAALNPTVCEAEGITDRPVWQVLAGLTQHAAMTATVRYEGAPYGVGYCVATWTPSIQIELVQ